jgi:hypothetical protein
MIYIIGYLIISFFWGLSLHVICKFKNKKTGFKASLYSGILWPFGIIVFIVLPFVPMLNISENKK